ncbi:ThiF family adenylyltransferase [Sporosarcina ureilytica]|uniref:Thiamine biosynthesis protein MoeB n=1 Tax=Sporosarcina ureilytica TaxID=298596 RepID=A0A1D8JCZ1_9BACL|nr:ThiF family adenylyltransferase [Sporosarcina ureilytica]AOV06578.1 thiamine biosynthesis protein MoeB [Sporosarcina ureilytica]
MNNRYSRQELFAPIGIEGQKRIRAANIFILGAGALGSSSGEMLVRAGVKRVTIVDRDIIDWTNLHRQQLYTEQDVIDQLPKAVAAEKRLKSINGDVDVSGMVVDVTAENVLDLIEGHDVILDATDNIETRLLMNDAALKRSLPFFIGACVGSYGLTFPIGIKEEQPCLHCLLETLPPQSLTCDTVGVISPIVVTTAARQVADVLKYITGNEFMPKLESANLWTGERSSMNVESLKKDNCPSCSAESVYPYLSARESTRFAVLCGRDTVQLSWPPNRRVELKTFVNSVEPIVQKLIHNPHLAAFEFDSHRIVLFRDGRMLIHGTKDIAEARMIAAKLLG